MSMDPQQIPSEFVKVFLEQAPQFFKNAMASGLCECTLHVVGKAPVKFTGKVQFDPPAEGVEIAFAE